MNSTTLAPFPWIDVAVILILILVNGLFAMAELSIVSSRKARLQAMVRRGKAGARIAIQLNADPSRLLSTVQIGISLIAVVSGAYSGEALGGPVGARIEALGLGLRHETAYRIGFILVIGIVTFVSLIIGELVPKQLALRAPEPIAVIAARPMLWLAKATAPLVWLLDRTSAGIFRLLGLNRESESHVTAEELHLIVAEASKSGVIEESERQIISGVVRLADRPVREVMTPRTEVDWIDADADHDTLMERLGELPHSRIPVAEGSVDAIIGIVQARDIVQTLIGGRDVDLRRLMKAACVVPDHVDAMDALEALRHSEVPLALVHDEYGHLEGIVTPADLLAAIAGEFASDKDEDGEPAIVEREDGSLLVSGWCPADTLAARIGLHLPEERDYATVAGLALDSLKHIPEVGETFVSEGWKYEILDLDGRKIDKLLVSEARRGEA
ncbi:MAG TPA: hemolysin family protein [Sphingomonas sp.]|jgi:putative hemolysin|nr:hemolysin family protein [Sphingomonas sp.]